MLVVDRAKIDRLNRIDPAITVATLPEFAVVEAGRMIATVKIIPFAVAGASLVRGGSGGRRARPRRAFSAAQGRARGDIAAVAEAVGDGQDAAAPRGAARAGGRAPRPRRSASRTTPPPSRRARGAEGGGMRHPHRLRCIGDGRRRRRGARGDRRRWRPGGPFRHAGRSGQPARPRRARRGAGDRRAWLRPKPEGERLRLGALSPARRTGRNDG